MGIFSGISALMGLADRASEQLEYWREYEGERILILHSSISRRSGKNNEQVKLTNYIIEGDIDDVMSFPPGFRLKNVEEYVDMANYEYIVANGFLTTEGKIRLRDNSPIKEIEEKFVSFDSIEQIERLEHHKEITEPLVEERDSIAEEDEFGDARDMLG